MVIDVKARNGSIVMLTASILSISFSGSAFGHTDINVGDITIEVGWMEEPPLVGELNAIILEFTEQSGPLVIDTRSLAVTLRYGGVTKTLELEPTEELGLYSSPIIPTRLGSYIVGIKGVAGGNSVDAEIPIEDVEDKQKIAFPDSSPESVELKNLASQIQSSVNQLQVKVDQASGKISSAESNSKEAKEMVTDLSKDAERAYDFGMIGMGLGAAGVVMAIASMTRRTKTQSS